MITAAMLNYRDLPLNESRFEQSWVKNC